MENFYVDSCFFGVFEIGIEDYRLGISQIYFQVIYKKGNLFLCQNMERNDLETSNLIHKSLIYSLKKS